jgi:hypothetical protein
MPEIPSEPRRDSLSRGYSFVNVRDQIKHRESVAVGDLTAYGQATECAWQLLA